MLIHCRRSSTLPSKQPGEGPRARGQARFGLAMSALARIRSCFQQLDRAPEAPGLDAVMDKRRGPPASADRTSRHPSKCWRAARSVRTVRFLLSPLGPHLPGRIPGRVAPRSADAAQIRGLLRRRSVRRRCPRLARRLLAARFPRAYLDLNREPYELDPELVA